MAVFSLINTGALVWLVSDSWQAHFEGLLVCFKLICFATWKALEFCMAHTTAKDSGSIATYVFGVAGDSSLQSILGGLLGEELHQYLSSLHLFAEWEISWDHNIFVWDTVDFFFDSIKWFSMFRSPYKWYIFLDKFSQAITKFCQSGRVLAKVNWLYPRNSGMFDFCWLWHFVNCLNFFISWFLTIRMWTWSPKNGMSGLILKLVHV